jgi:lysophospholipid acyltransferase (LPLAT)-like uncharacterized protein
MSVIMRHVSTEERRGMGEKGRKGDFLINYIVNPYHPLFPFSPSPFHPPVPFFSFSPFAFINFAMQATIKTEGQSANERATKSVENAYKFADLSPYSFKQRLLIRLADLFFFLLISIIGRTTRFEVEGWENWEAIKRDGKIPIYTFWHDRIFLSTYFWRDKEIVVMTSQSFDGEYIARFIQRFGYGASRGSSTRGGIGALVEMIRLMSAGKPTAFTIDGPKGPRYVAKMGAVLLAKKTGQPILPFCITPKKFWTVNSWDKFQIPKPFTKAQVIISEPIYVPSDADEELAQKKNEELQRVLDEMVKQGDEWRNHEAKK